MTQGIPPLSQVRETEENEPMIPIIIPAGKHCHCERDNWTRRPGVGGELVICGDCGYIATATADDPGEPSLHTVTLVLCHLCLTGAGGECHSPGCQMFLNRAPDLPLTLMIDTLPADEPDGSHQS